MSTPENKPQTVSVSVVERIKGDQFREALAAVLPKHVNPKSFRQVAISACTKQPDLKQCDPVTVYSSLMKLAQCGLEPDGRLAAVIPYWNGIRKCKEAQAQIMYQGLVELMLNSGLYSNVHCDEVCENDTFSYNKGQLESHRPNWKDRGEPYLYYCLITSKDGSEKCEVMTKAEVDAVRSRSRNRDGGPWSSDYKEMAKKTVLKRASKYCKLSKEQRVAIEEDDPIPATTINMEPPALVPASAAMFEEIEGPPQESSKQIAAPPVQFDPPPPDEPPIEEPPEDLAPRPPTRRRKPSPDSTAGEGPTGLSPQDMLEQWVTGLGASYDTFAAASLDGGVDVSSYPEFKFIPANIAQQCLQKKSWFLGKIRELQGGAK